MLPLMLLAFAACGEKNSDPGENPDKLVPDPEGTIEVSARYDAHTGVAGIRIDNAYNFSGYGDSYFVSLGKMRGLGNVTSIPKNGWATNVAVVPGNGYVAYSEGMFYRIYVVEEVVGTTGGVIGYTFKYQAPFAGRDEELKLSQTSVTVQAGEQTGVAFLDSDIIPFSIYASEPWITVTPASSREYPFLVDALLIAVSEYGDKTSTKGEIVLQTLYNKIVKIDVTRTFEPFVSVADPTQADPLVLDPVGEKRRIPLVSNIGSNLVVEIYGDANWCKVDLEPKEAPSYLRNLRFVGDKPIDEKLLTRTQSTFYYDAVFTVSSNFKGGYRGADFCVSAPSLPYQQPLFRLTQEGFVFSLEEKKVLIPKEGDVKTIRTSTNLRNFDNLKVTSTEAWCKPVLSSSVSNLQLTIDANNRKEGRSADVKVFDFDNNEIASMQVVQYGTGLFVEQSKMYFQRNFGAQTIVVNLPDGMMASDIQCSENWLSATMTGTDNKSLTIRVAEATEDRVGYVTFKGYSDRIEVHQSKYAVGDIYSEDGVEGTVYKMEEGTGWLYKKLGQYLWSTEKVFLGATDMTDGRINTEIVKKQPNWQANYPAFAAVDALNVGGVTGWYFPAVDEIHDGYTWTSTELNDAAAYYIDGRDNITELSKRYQSMVYAVHRFEY